MLFSIPVTSAVISICVTYKNKTLLAFLSDYLSIMKHNFTYFIFEVMSIQSVKIPSQENQVKLLLQLIRNTRYTVISLVYVL